MVAALLAAAPALLAAAPAWALDPGRSLGACTVTVSRGRDGLPSSWVRSIVQTPDGLLWIGTSGGLARYDGARLVTQPSPRPFARGADVFKLLLGRSGAPYIVTSYDDPMCLGQRDGKTVLSECFPPGQRLPRGVRAVNIAEEPGGVIWVGTRTGLYRLEKGGITLHLGASELPFERMQILFYDSRGRLLVGGTSGLYQLVDKRLVPVTTSLGTISTAAYSVFENAQRQLWVAARGWLWRLEGNSAVRYELPHNNSLSQVIEDRDGNVWIGGDTGLTRFYQGRFDHFGATEGLPDNQVTALYEDREGSLWVGTRAGGVAQFTDRTLDTHAGPPVLANDWVDSVAEDTEGTLWFGTRNALVRYKDGAETIFRTADGVPSGNVSTVLPDKDGAVWATSERALLRYHERESPRLQLVAHLATSVQASYFDRGGNLYLGGDGVLLRLDAQDLRAALGGAAPLPPRPPLVLETGFSLGGVRGIAQDDRGTLWIASTGGLAVVEGDQAGQFGQGAIVRRATLPPALGLLTARALHHDDAGVLWIASSASGLVRLAGGRFETFTLPTMLSEQLHQMLSDDLGNLWVGTGSGVFRVAKAALTTPRSDRPIRVVSFDTSDKRQDVSAANVRQPGAWKGRDGRLWFASSRGPITIDPRRIRINELPPPVHIEEVIVDGKAARRTGGIEEFGPGPGNLEFRYTAVTLLEPWKAVHRYQLEGFDKGWIEAGSRRVAYYTNIPPGNYRFRVQGSNADGVWNEVGERFELRLRPHFFQTVWFFGLCVLGVGGLGMLLYRMRIGSLRREYLATFAERSRLARELHDTLLQGMSVVAMQLGSVRRRLGGNVDRGVVRDLESIEGVVTMSLEETRRMVWNLRERPVNAGDLGATLARLAERMSEGRGATCQVTVEGPELRLSNELQDSLFRIAQEALANALKHAGAKHIDLRLCYEEGAVKLTVADDGRGFDPEAAQGASAGHFGLVGMRERAARIAQSSLTVTSRPGAGTTVTMAVALHPTPGAGGGSGNASNGGASA